MFFWAGAIAHGGAELLPRMQEAWLSLPKSSGGGGKKAHFPLIIKTPSVSSV